MLTTVVGIESLRREVINAIPAVRWQAAPQPCSTLVKMQNTTNVLVSNIAVKNLQLQLK